MLTAIHNIYRTATKQIEDHQTLVASILHQISISPEKILNSRVFSPNMGYCKSHSITRHLKIAIDYLQDENNQNKLTVIDELGELAHHYPQYHWLIMEVLSSYVRNHDANISPESSICSEIQAALNVIAHRDAKQDPENEQLDLSHTNLKNANLHKANLEQGNLYRVNLSGANLSGANLSGTIMSAANLSQANLVNANLSESILTASNLVGANLTGANFAHANLYLANLQEVVLDQTIFKGANLREAKFTITGIGNVSS